MSFTLEHVLRAVRHPVKWKDANRLKPFYERAKQLKAPVMQCRVTLEEALVSAENGEPIFLREAYQGSTGDIKLSVLYFLASLERELGLTASLLRNGDAEELREFLHILYLPMHPSFTEHNCSDAFSAYRTMFLQFANTYENGSLGVVESPWKDFVLRSMITRHTVFTTKSAESVIAEIGPSVIGEYDSFAVQMRKVYDFNPEFAIHSYLALLKELRCALRSAYAPHLDSENYRPPLPQLDKFTPTGKRVLLTDAEQRQQSMQESLIELMKRIAAMPDWNGLGNIIAEHNYSQRMVRSHDVWTVGMSMSGLGFHPVRKNRVFDLDSHFGYEEQKRQLIANTEALLDGRQSYNAVIIGSRGTGKSSLLNGLLQRYSGRGLKVLELKAQHIPYLSAIFSGLESYHQNKFLVVFDDFKIGRDDDIFEALKSAMASSFSETPKNSRVYIVSNEEDCLRHMGMHRGNGELLSLEDRFGLIVRLEEPTPQQQRVIFNGTLARYGVSDEVDAKWKALESHYQAQGIKSAEISPRQIVMFIDANYARRAA